MAFSLNQFNTLDFEAQIVKVWDEGRFIATRYEEEDTVGLYHMRGGFFVEVFYNGSANHIVERTRPFPSHDRDSLEDYAVYVNLDDLGVL